MQNVLHRFWERQKSLADPCNAMQCKALTCCVVLYPFMRTQSGRWTVTTGNVGTQGIIRCTLYTSFFSSIQTVPNIAVSTGYDKRILRSCDIVIRVVEQCCHRKSLGQSIGWMPPIVSVIYSHRRSVFNITNIIEQVCLRKRREQKHYIALISIHKRSICDRYIQKSINVIIKQ